MKFFPRLKANPDNYTVANYGVNKKGLNYLLPASNEFRRLMNSQNALPFLHSSFPLQWWNCVAVGEKGDSHTILHSAIYLPKRKIEKRERLNYL